MKEYNLRKGETLTLTADKDMRIRIDDFAGIMTIEVQDLVMAKRVEAERLLREADEIEKIRGL